MLFCFALLRSAGSALFWNNDSIKVGKGQHNLQPRLSLTWLPSYFSNEIEYFVLTGSGYVLSRAALTALNREIKVCSLHSLTVANLAHGSQNSGNAIVSGGMCFRSQVLSLSVL